MLSGSMYMYCMHCAVWKQNHQHKCKVIHEYSETCLKWTPTGPSLLSVNRGVRLVQVHFTEKIREEKLVFTEAGVRLMQGVPLIWGLLNTGFTVLCLGN